MLLDSFRVNLNVCVPAAACRFSSPVCAPRAGAWVARTAGRNHPGHGPGAGRTRSPSAGPRLRSVARRRLQGPRGDACRAPGLFLPARPASGRPGWIPGVSRPSRRQQPPPRTQLRGETSRGPAPGRRAVTSPGWPVLDMMSRGFGQGVTQGSRRRR